MPWSELPPRTWEAFHNVRAVKSAEPRASDVHSTQEEERSWSPSLFSECRAQRWRWTPRERTSNALRPAPGRDAARHAIGAESSSTGALRRQTRALSTLLEKQTRQGLNSFSDVGAHPRPAQSNRLNETREEASW